MSSIIIPKNYDPKYGIMETEIAIKVAKDCFERELAKALDLTRISAPMFVRKSAGINDNLNGVERPVAFEMLEMPDTTLEIVHSLAKWKRIALKQYGVEAGKGIYKEMKIWIIHIQFMWISGTGKKLFQKKTEIWTF